MYLLWLCDLELGYHGHNFSILVPYCRQGAVDSPLSAGGFHVCSFQNGMSTRVRNLHEFDFENEHEYELLRNRLKVP